VLHINRCETVSFNGSGNLGSTTPLIADRWVVALASTRVALGFQEL
jgi:hypothetical protein